MKLDRPYSQLTTKLVAVSLSASQGRTHRHKTVPGAPVRTQKGIITELKHITNCSLKTLAGDLLNPAVLEMRQFVARK